MIFFLQRIIAPGKSQKNGHFGKLAAVENIKNSVSGNPTFEELVRAAQPVCPVYKTCGFRGFSSALRCS